MRSCLPVINGEVGLHALLLMCRASCQEVQAVCSAQQQHLPMVHLLCTLGSAVADCRLSGRCSAGSRVPALEQRLSRYIEIEA